MSETQELLGGWPQVTTIRCARSSLRSPAAVALEPLCERFLGRHTESLVRLGALLAVNAPPASLRWAVDLAAAAGVDDEEVVATLIAVAFIAGSAQAVCTSPSLALALGFDVEEEDASSAR